MERRGPCGRVTGAAFRVLACIRIGITTSISSRWRRRKTILVKWIHFTSARIIAHCIGQRAVAAGEARVGHARILKAPIPHHHGHRVRPIGHTIGFAVLSLAALSVRACHVPAWVINTSTGKTEQASATDDARALTPAHTFAT